MAEAKNINIRQRTFYSNKNIAKSDYRYVSLFQYSNQEDEPIRIIRSRNGREKLTCPAKKTMNDKRAKLYFDLLVKGNFTENDYFISLTYSDSHLPADEAEAENQIKKYTRDLRREAKKLGIKNLKYIYITESGSIKGRIHHHMLLDGNLPRELVERLWSKQVRPFRPEREMLGWCNAKRMQVTGPDYMTRISRYLTKDPKGKKRWKQSTGLILPGTSKADNICSIKQFEQMSLFGNNMELELFVRKQHRGFVIIETETKLNEMTGQWYIYLQLMRKKLWQQTMAICNVAAKTKIGEAEKEILDIPEYRATEIQGDLWGYVGW